MEGEAQEDEEVEEEVDMEDKVEELDEEEMEGLLVGMWARQSQHWRSIAAWGQSCQLIAALHAFPSKLALASARSKKNNSAFSLLVY